MYVLSQLLMALGLVALLASCTLGPMVGLYSYGIAFGLLIVGVLMRLAAKAPAPDPDRPSAATHTRCPECRELVRMDASKCKHCGSALVPSRPPAGMVHNPPSDTPVLNVIGGIVLVLAAVSLLSYCVGR